MARTQILVHRWRAQEKDFFFTDRSNQKFSSVCDKVMTTINTFICFYREVSIFSSLEEAKFPIVWQWLEVLSNSSHELCRMESSLLEASKGACTVEK